MYAGFITHKRAVARLGIHQRFDMAAYKMIRPYLPDTFPTLKEIWHFEGYNGPDGINVKSKGLSKLRPRQEGDAKPSHFYDPSTDTGEVPMHIANHYTALVETLKNSDIIRASFEAAWLAHYIADGLTPAHHWPLEEKLAEAADKASRDIKNGDTSKFAAQVKKNWAVWGAKGHMTTHFNFEMGVAFAMLVFPIKAEFTEHELSVARRLGPVEYFKTQARAVAALQLYERFYREGWNADIAYIVKNQLAPQAVRAIGNIWLLALLDAGQQMAVAEAEAEVVTAA
jgi:hypothetical protein